MHISKESGPWISSTAPSGCTRGPFLVPRKRAYCHLSHRCDKIIWQKQLQGGRIHFGLQSIMMGKGWWLKQPASDSWWWELTETASGHWATSTNQEPQGQNSTTNWCLCFKHISWWDIGHLKYSNELGWFSVKMSYLILIGCSKHETLMTLFTLKHIAYCHVNTRQPTDLVTRGSVRWRSFRHLKINQRRWLSLFLPPGTHRCG